MNDQIELALARMKGHAAAQAAADHADRVRVQWTATAVAFLRTYVAKHRGAFLAEDVRAASLAWGLPEAPDGRAWGHVMKRAEREGVIVAVGYSGARSSNGSPKVLWRAR
jgi:hypothetical protein